ncbi:HAMP domain-containing sensor histidine kinase [Halorubrum sp. F4]|uniref:sensor histidine kinase n=1 Tax=Halorubrum sp. F4 TaxID=2989715 RepID=UPI0024813B12|nr:HAMP domain-containing sensor histidine kinase [Halorubrum sp. F4]
MSSPPSRIRPQHAVYALGSFCFGLGIVHLLTEGEGLGTILETFVTCSISLLVLVTAYEFPDRPISEAGQWRAVRLGFGVTGAFALLALAVWTIWLVEGNPTELSFLLSFASALGAMVGVRSGLHAVEFDERLEEAEDLGKLLTINQRVLRHNLRNELSIALGHLDNIEIAERVEDTNDDVRIIREHLERLLETTDRTREIVTIWNADRTVEHRLTSMVDERITRVRRKYPGVEISTRFEADPRVRSHPDLPAAVEEALTNAIEHTPPDTSVTVTVRTDSKGSAVLEIADTGEGIPRYDVDAIESPAETPLVHTQGLGLWILYWTLETSDGTLEIAENEPTGTIVRMTFPTLREHAPGARRTDDTGRTDGR